MDQSQSNQSVSRSLLSTILEDSVFDGLGGENSDLSFTLIGNENPSVNETSTSSSGLSKTLVSVPETPPSVLRKRIQKASENNEALNNELKELSEYTKLERQILWAEMNFPLIKENLELTEIIHSLNGNINQAKDFIKQNDEDVQYVKEIIESRLYDSDRPTDSGDAVQNHKVDLTRRIEKIVDTNARLVGLLKPANVPEPSNPPSVDVRELEKEKSEHLTLLNAELLDKVEKIKTLSEKLDETRTAMDALNENKITLSNETDHLRSELRRFQTLFENQTVEIDILRANDVKLQKRIAQLEDSLEASRQAQIDNLSLLDRIASLEMNTMSLTEDKHQLEEELDDFKRLVAETATSAYLENVEMATQLLPKFVDDFKMMTNQLAVDSFKLSPYLVGVTELINGIVGTLQPGYDASQTVSLTFDVVEKYESELSEKTLKESAMKAAFEDFVTVVKEVECFTPALCSLEDEVNNKMCHVGESLSSLEGRMNELFLKNTEGLKSALNRKEERIKVLEEKLTAAKLDIENKYRIIEKDLRFFRNLAGDSLDKQEPESDLSGGKEKLDQEMDGLKESLQNKFQVIVDELARAKESLNKAEEEKYRCEQRLANEIDALKNEIDSLQNRYDPDATSLLSLDVTAINEPSDDELRDMRQALRLATLEAAKIVREKEDLIEKMSAELVAVRNAFDPNCTDVMAVDVSGINSEPEKDQVVELNRLVEKVDSLQSELNEELSAKERALTNLKDLVDWTSKLFNVEPGVSVTLENIEPLRATISEAVENFQKMESHYSLKLEELEKMRKDGLLAMKSLQEQLESTVNEHAEFIRQKQELEISLTAKIEALEKENKSFKSQYDPNASGLMSLNVTQLNEFNVDNKQELESLKSELHLAESGVIHLEEELKIRQDLLEAEKQKTSEHEADRVKLDVIIKKLQDEVATRQREMEESIGELNKLRIEHETLLKSHEELNSLCDSYRNDVTHYRDQLELAVKDLEEKQSEFQPVAEQIEELRDKILQVCDENDNLRRQIELIEEEKLSSNSEIQNLNEELKRLNEVQQSQAEEIAKLDKGLKEAEDEKIALNERIVLMSEAEQELQLRVTATTLLNDELKTSSEKDKACLELELTEAIAKLEDLWPCREEAMRRNEELTILKEQLLRQIKETEALRVSKEAEMEAARAQLEELSRSKVMLEEKILALEGKLKFAEDVTANEREELLSGVERLKELEAQLTSALSELDSSKDEINRLNEVVKSTEERVASLTSQLEETDSIRMSKESELAAALAQLVESTRSTDSFAEKLKSAEELAANQREELLSGAEKLKELETELTNACSELDSNKNEIDRLNEVVKLTEERVTLLTSQLEDADAIRMSKESELAAALAQLELSTQSNEVEADSLAEKLKSAQELAANQREELLSSAEKLKELETELTNARSELDSSKHEINRLNEVVKSTEERVASLTSQLEETDSIRMSKEAELAAAFAQLVESTRSTDSFAEKLKSAEELAANQREELLSSAEKLKELETELTNARSELVSSKDEINRLNEVVKSTEERVTSLTSQLEDADTIRMSKESELAAALAQLAESTQSKEVEADSLAEKLKSAQELAANQREELLSGAEKLKELETELTNARSELDSSKDEINRLNEVVKSTEERVASLTSQLVETDVMRMSKESEIAVALAQLEESKESEMRSFAEKLNAAESELTVMRSELESLKSAVTSKETELAELLTVEKSKESEIVNLSDKLKSVEDRAAKLAEEVVDLSEKLNASHSELAAVRSELEQLKKSEESKREEMCRLNEQMKSVEDCVTSLTGQIELSEALAQLEIITNVVQAKDAQRLSMAEELQTAENRIVGLSTQIAELESMCDTLRLSKETEVASALAELENYRTSEETKQAEILRLCEQVLLLEDRIASLTADNAQAKARYDELEESKQNEIYLLKENVKSSEERIASLSTQNAELLSTIETLTISKESDLQNAFEELEKYRNSALGCDAEMTDLKNETDNLRACLEQAKGDFQNLELKLRESETLNATLRQELDKTMTELKNSSEQQRNEIVRLTYESNLIQTQCTSMKAKQESFLMNIDSLQRELAEKEEQIVKKTTELIELNQKLDQLTTETTSPVDVTNEKLQRLAVKLEEVEKEKMSALEKLGMYEERFHDVKAELKRMKSQVDNELTSAEEVKSLKRQLQDARIQVTTLKSELDASETERCALMSQLQMQTLKNDFLVTETQSNSLKITQLEKQLEDSSIEVKRLETALCEAEEQLASFKVAELETSKKSKNEIVAEVNDQDEEMASGSNDNDVESGGSSAFGTPSALRFPELEDLPSAVARRLRFSSEAADNSETKDTAELESGIMQIFQRFNETLLLGGSAEEPLPLGETLKRFGDAVEDALETKRFLMDARPASKEQQSIKITVENLYNEFTGLSMENSKLQTMLSRNSEKFSLVNNSLQQLKDELKQLKNESTENVVPLRVNFNRIRSFMKDIVEQAEEIEDLRESLSFCRNEFVKLETSFEELKKTNQELAAQYEDKDRSYNSLLEQNNSINELQCKLFEREADCDKFKLTVAELTEKLSVSEKSSLELSDRLGQMSLAINSLIVNFNGQPIDLSGATADDDIDALVLLKRKLEDYNRDLLSVLCRLNYDSNKGTAWEFLSVFQSEGISSDERVKLLESQLIESNNFKSNFVRELISLEPSLSVNDLMNFSPENLLKQMLGVIMEKEAAIIENIQLEAKNAEKSLKSQLTDMENEVKWRSEKLAMSETDKDELAKKVDRLEEEINSLKRGKASMNETYTVCSVEETALKEKLASLMTAVERKDRECEELKKSLKDYEARLDELKKESDRMKEDVSKTTSCENSLKDRVTELESLVNQLKEERDRLIDDIKEKEVAVENAQHEKSENERHLLSLQNIMVELKESGSVLKQNLDNKCQEIAGLRQRIAQHEKSTATYEETIVSKNAELMRINDVLSARDKEVGELQSRLAGFESEINSLRTVVTHLQTTNESLQQKAAQLESSIEEQKCLVSSSNVQVRPEEIVDLKELVASLESRCETLVMEKESLQVFKKQCHALQAKQIADSDRFAVIKKNLEEDLSYKSLKISELHSQLDECAKEHEREMQTFKLKEHELEKEILTFKTKEKRFEEQLFSQRTLFIKEKAALEEQITKSAQMLRNQREELVQFFNRVSEALGVKVVSIESACTALTRLKEELEEEKTKNTDLDEECDDLKNQIDGISAREVAYFERVEKLEEDNQRLANEVKSLNDRLESQTSDVAGLKQKLADAKSQLTSCRQLASESETIVATFKAEQKKNAELTLSLRATKEQLDECRLHLRNVRDELKHARNSMEDLQAAKAALYDEFCTLQSQTEASKKQTASLKQEAESEINRLKHKVSLMEKHIEKLEGEATEVQSLRNKVSELERQVKETRVLQESRTVNVNAITSTSKSNDDSRLAELQKKIDKLSSDRNVLKKLCVRRKAQITFYENNMRDHNIPVPEFKHHEAS